MSTCPSNHSFLYIFQSAAAPPAAQPAGHPAGQPGPEPSSGADPATQEEPDVEEVTPAIDLPRPKKAKPRAGIEKVSSYVIYTHSFIHNKKWVQDILTPLVDDGNI